jgi:ABC-2 type transport system ATP-binding protein
VADGPGAALKAAVTGRRLRFVCDSVEDLDDLDGVVDVEVRGLGVTLDSLDADATVRDLVRRNVSLSDLEITGMGLEDAFVALTCRESILSGSGSR